MVIIIRQHTEENEINLGYESKHCKYHSFQKLELLVLSYKFRIVPGQL